jgi:hypothetical protein
MSALAKRERMKANTLLIMRKDFKGPTHFLSYNGTERDFLCERTIP